MRRAGRTGLRRFATLALVLLGLAGAATAAERPLPGSVAASGPMSRPDGSVDLATFWIFAKCGANQIKGPDGCSCAPGFRDTDAGCLAMPDPVIEEEPPRRAARPAPPPPKPAAAKPAAAKPAASKPAKKPAPRNGIAGFETGGRPCIDGDLLKLVTDTYGRKRGLSACSAGCIARPTGSLRSAAELDRLAKANGIAWCPESCIKVTGWMPTAEVVRLERFTGRRFCPVDGQNYCRARDNVAVPMATTIERVLAFAPTPAPAARPGEAALVLGLDGYRGALPKGDHGRRDAEAVKALMTGKLGYAEDAVVLAADLDKAAFLKAIGPEGDLAKANPTQSIFLYVSGHGMSDPETGEAYLLPVDADPADLKNTAIALQDIYEALGRLGAPSVMVALEASFPTSLGDLIDPPNLPERDVRLMPARPIAGLSVFTAADRDQQTLVDPDLGTGLFTRYLLEGLAGAADSEPTGNGDRRIESVELYVFTAHRVRVTARKSFGLEQKPLIAESRNALVRSF